MHQHTDVTDVYLIELLKVNNKEDNTEQTILVSNTGTTWRPHNKHSYSETNI